jgi:predicted nucleotidyltransferase
MRRSTRSYDLRTTKKIILDHLRGKDAKVYLFGSHATGKARMHSDIDIAILPRRKLPPMILTEIREKLEESDVVRTVEIVDLSQTDAAFRRRVLKEGIPWKD